MDNELSKRQRKRKLAETKRKVIKRIKNSNRFIAVEITDSGYAMTSSCSRADYAESGLMLIKESMEEEIPFIEKFLLWSELLQILDKLESGLNEQFFVPLKGNEEEENI